MRSSSNTLRLVFFLIVSVALMAVDHQSGYLQQVRSVLAVAAYPLQWVAGLPAQLGAALGGLSMERDELKQRYTTLRREHLLFQARLQRMEAVEAENARLRKLLGAASRAADRAIVGRLLEVSLEPYTQKVLVDKGGRNDVTLGQPVIDARGVMGQITQITPFSSTVTLITDPSHVIPVQIRRTGVRGLLFGNGVGLDLPHLMKRSGVQVGDLLVTSGMGRRFPSGYPVARVVDVQADPDSAFLAISAEPVAGLDRAKEVLLIWPGAETTSPAARTPHSEVPDDG